MSLNRPLFYRAETDGRNLTVIGTNIGRSFHPVTWFLFGLGLLSATYFCQKMYLPKNTCTEGSDGADAEFEGNGNIFLPPRHPVHQWKFSLLEH